jgi:hypothetical protein
MHNKGTAAECACRDGWFTLLARVLEAMATCAGLRRAHDDALACCLELVVISSPEPLSQRAGNAHHIAQAAFVPSYRSSSTN